MKGFTLAAWQLMHGCLKESIQTQPVALIVWALVITMNGYYAILMLRKSFGKKQRKSSSNALL